MAISPNSLPNPKDRRIAIGLLLAIKGVLSGNVQNGEAFSLRFLDQTLGIYCKEFGITRADAISRINTVLFNTDRRSA